MKLVSISGSPSAPSRSTWLLRLAVRRLAAAASQHHEIVVRELPAQALLQAQAQEPQLAQALGRVAAADVVVVATPVYKAAYSGVLKAFLDLLPQDALRGKSVLALATGGSPGHLLALDYALKPVLGALGARHIADAVYAADSQLVPGRDGGWVADAELLERLDRALAGLQERPAPWRPAAPRAEAALHG